MTRRLLILVTLTSLACAPDSERYPKLRDCEVDTATLNVRDSRSAKGEKQFSLKRGDIQSLLPPVEGWAELSGQPGHYLAVRYMKKPKTGVTRTDSTLNQSGWIQDVPVCKSEQELRALASGMPSPNCWSHTGSWVLGTTASCSAITCHVYTDGGSFYLVKEFMGHTTKKVHVPRADCFDSE